jgi:phage shock protein A
MGLFDRFRRVVQSNINEMISKAENPEKMLNQLIMEMNEQLIESKKSVASAIADEKRLQRQLIEQRRNNELWEQRAMDAVRAGKDDLAKQALVRKQEHAEYATSYQEQYDAQHTSVEQLKSSLRQLQQKIEEASRKKNLLIARAKRAEAQQRIQATISATGNTSAFDAFDRMADKVEQAEAEAEATDDLAKLDTGDVDLEKQFKELEGGGSAEQLLEDLKSKMKQIEDKSSEGESRS